MKKGAKNTTPVIPIEPITPHVEVETPVAEGPKNPNYFIQFTVRGDNNTILESNFIHGGFTTFEIIGLLNVELARQYEEVLKIGREMENKEVVA